MRQDHPGRVRISIGSNFNYMQIRKNMLIIPRIRITQSIKVLSIHITLVIIIVIVIVFSAVFK